MVFVHAETQGNTSTVQGTYDCSTSGPGAMGGSYSTGLLDGQLTNAITVVFVPDDSARNRWHATAQVEGGRFVPLQIPNLKTQATQVAAGDSAGATGSITATLQP